MPLPIRTYTALQKHQPARTKPDIAAWISSSAPPAMSDVDADADERWSRAGALADWPAARAHIAHALLASSTHARIAFLRTELIPLLLAPDVTPAHAADVFRALVPTAARYADAPSRAAAEAALLALSRTIAPQIAGWLNNEATRISGATHAHGRVLVLLGWAGALYTAVLAPEDKEWNEEAGSLLGALARLLDVLLQARPALRRAAAARARRTLRSAPKVLPDARAALLALARGPTGLAALPLLSVALACAPETLSAEHKTETLALYTGSVLSARMPVPPHTLVALREFVGVLSAEDLEGTILPAADKAVMRSPEVALDVLADFILAYSAPLTSAAFTRLLTPALAATKSASPTTRLAATRLYTSLVRRTPPPALADLARAATDVLALAGARAGPDKATLYAMLAALPSEQDEVCAAVADAGIAALSKEPTDALARALAPYLARLLRAESTAPAPVDAIAKELSGSKPVPRRAFLLLATDALWALHHPTSPPALSLSRAVLAPCDAALKAAATAPADALRAAALMLGPLSRAEGTADDAAKSALLTAAVAGEKGRAGWLLADKTRARALADAGGDEARWLARALGGAALRLHADLARADEKGAGLRKALGGSLLGVALEARAVEARREAVAAVERIGALVPALAGALVRDALLAYAARPTPAPGPAKAEKKDEAKPAPGAKKADAAAPADEDDKDKPPPHARLLAFLSAATTAARDAASPDERDAILARLVIPAHHGAVVGRSAHAWLEQLVRARADPAHLVSSLLEGVLLPEIDAAFAEGGPGSAAAALRALQVIAFVQPGAVLPALQTRLRDSLLSGARDANALGEQDLGIWAADPASGTPFVDVLAAAAPKKAVGGTGKGKGAEMDKWDAEVRQALKSKAAAQAGKTRSKAEQAAVDAQLAREAEIRARVEGLRRGVLRALHTVSALAEAPALGETDEMRAWAPAIAALLLESGVLGAGCAALLDAVPAAAPTPVSASDGSGAARDAFLALGGVCAPRLGAFARWAGLGILRARGISVPGALAEEPLGALAARVLYRLRAVAEQAPLRAPAFAYVFPLLGAVLQSGGVGIVEGEEGAAEAAFEQVALALDVVKFNVGEFGDASFPRVQVIESVLHALRTQPKLAKEASSALLALGETIAPTATRAEADALLAGTLVPEARARTACLQALAPLDLTERDWAPALLLAAHDGDAQNARLARAIWDDNGLDVPAGFAPELLALLEHDVPYVRAGAAAALGEAVAHWPARAGETVRALQDVYAARAQVLAPQFDQYGMLVDGSLERADPWAARGALAAALEALAPLLPPDAVVPLFAFLIDGEGAALGDRHADVRRAMLDAGAAAVDAHAAAHLPALIGMFEGHLARAQPASAAADHVQEAVVVLVGRAARHLDAGDERLPRVVARLVDALRTPSETVQVAVGDCLAPLVRATRGDAPALVKRLLEELCGAETYAARRGAAYGLAGALKGTGIGGMKDYGVLDALRRASEDKARFEARQGAMFALETLCATLGRVAEPHAISMLPLLLAAFGDGTPDVREAAQDAARALMRNMSGYGVKLVLPDLLEFLDEKQWRTKKGSIELLGMMAYCAPRQLSQSLPVVIPRLTGVLTDSHTQVRAAANRSLKQFGEVISNPEIQALVPVFLKAMVDPARTPHALGALLKTSFVHYIDHSSLALVIPILERGLRERGADTKRKAAQIVGNLASLTDSADFVPYLDELLPLVHAVLVDPVPEARATAAKTLGTLVERLGEASFPDLVPRLLRTLKADTSGVDRQGAAQGLSEVLAGLGMERLEGLLPDVIASAQAPRASVREGFMSLLVFLPATFGARFTPHLPKIIVPILKGLSDVEEYVREAAMKAGRMIIANYATRAIDLLLPELERGMFDPGWRIRQSSITLVGELLFKVSGISGKNEVDDDEDGVAADAAVAESSKRALTEVLGAARRDRILAALYLARQDAVHAVRTSSIHIWKALVSNTPRTVREILPTLAEHIMSLLCSLDEEQEETAARTTVELCRKFGERVVGEAVGILRERASSLDARTREGVVRMLCEIMAAATDSQWDGAEDAIIAMVRAALVDDEARVRAAAARAFDVLQEKLGARAIDATIPTLLEALRQPGASSGTALQALKEVMGVRANTVFPVLIPTLTAHPISAFNANALATLIAVAGAALSKRINVILGALAKMTESLRKTPDEEELFEAINGAVRALMESVDDAEGLNTLMLLLLGWIKHDDPERRITAADYFALFCEVSELDASLYRVDWIRVLVPAMDDGIVPVHTATWRAFDAFVKAVPKDELEPLVVPLRRALESTGSPHAPVPGFSLPKGPAPFVPVIIAGLTTGSNEQREQAAYAIGDLVERTEEAAIKPFVVPFTGPLIRVATQATTYPPAVKTGILSALTTMLERIPVFVKPFYPQLQRTFIKSASDPASVVVRSKAAVALGVLMRSQPRVDPVVAELVTGARQNDDSIGSSLIQALAYVVRSANTNVGPAARETALELVVDAFRTQNDEAYTQSVAQLFAALTVYGDLVQPVINANLTTGADVNPLSTHCILAVLTAHEEDDSHDKALPPVIAASLPLLAKKINENLTSDRVNVTRPSREAKELLRRIDPGLI